MTSTSTPVSSAKHHSHMDRGLVVIGVFKMLEAVFLVCMGFGALHFLHHDLSDTLLRIVTERGFDPENRFVSLILGESAKLTSLRLKQISLGTFAYAALHTLEGIGLVMRKSWAEYFTLWLSISFLPWEIYEICRHVTAIRFGIFLTNVAIVLYLAWILRRKKQNDTE